MGLLGITGVGPIAFRQFSGVASCPTVGLVPVCYVVLLGYAIVAVSVFIHGRRQLVFFLAGWTPIFGLALLGSSMEVLGSQVCPRSANDIPTCFFSLAMALLLIGAFSIFRIATPAIHGQENLADERPESK